MSEIGTKLEFKKVEGDKAFVRVTYEAAAWEAGPNGKHVTCEIQMGFRPDGQEVETVIDFGKRTRPTILKSFDDLADQFEWMAEAIRNRKMSLNQIPCFLP